MALSSTEYLAAGCHCLGGSIARDQDLREHLVLGSRPVLTTLVAFWHASKAAASLTLHFSISTLWSVLESGSQCQV